MVKRTSRKLQPTSLLCLNRKPIEEDSGIHGLCEPMGLCVFELCMMVDKRKEFVLIDTLTVICTVGIYTSV